MPPSAGTLVDRSKLEAAYKSFNTIFNDALSRAPRLYESLSTIIRSSAPVEIYNWLGSLPKMRRWIGDRALSKLKAYDWSIRNENWANGIEVDRDDLADDRLGLVRPRIGQLASMAEIHKDELLFSLLVGGFTALGPDGQLFFDTDHQFGSETAWSNKATAALSAVAYNAAQQSMMERVDDIGEPLLIRGTHLVCGPKNRATALEILKAERNADGSSNINFNSAELIVSQRLVGAYDDYWFLLDLSQEIKPLILQIKQDVQFVAQDDPAAEHAFMRRVFRYGADWSGNAGYGLPQMAYGSIL